jgi:hypothetical protein
MISLTRSELLQKHRLSAQYLREKKSYRGPRLTPPADAMSCVLIFKTFTMNAGKQGNWLRLVLLILAQRVEA